MEGRRWIRGGGYLAIRKADNIDRWMKQYLDQDNRGCKVDLAVGGKGPLYRWWCFVMRRRGVEVSLTMSSNATSVKVCLATLVIIIKCHPGDSATV